jgi:tetratricopeptide (TPR) repeat protein
MTRWHVRGASSVLRRASRRARRTWGIAALVAMSACAPKVVPLPTVTTPKFPDFIQPAVPPSFAGSPVAAAQARGWTFLQAGDLKSADREFSLALKTAPTFYPAEDGLGYLALANKDAKAALPHFERALEDEPGDVSAMVGRGQALLAVNRTDEALAQFRAALVADPSLSDIRQRVEVLSFRSVEQNVDRARAAARAGRSDEAIQAYNTAIAASPESPFLYRELAAVERQKGDVADALQHFRKAASLDPGDARTLEQIGELLEQSGDYEAAEKAYNESLAVESNAAVERRLEELRAKIALARLPAEYRAIDQAPQITRADLAALIGIRLAPLLQGPRSRDAALITDVRNNWAATWIVAVARAGVMEPYANHAFQPRSVVRRSDLAQAVARLLAKIAAQHPGRQPAWESARLKFSDLGPGHLAYPAASVAVASGVMKTAPGDAFQPSRPVSGAEAIEAIDKLRALAGV